MSSDDPRGGDQSDDEQQIEEELSLVGPHPPSPPVAQRTSFTALLKLSGTIVNGSLQSAPIKHAALAQQRPAFPASSPVSPRKENPLSLGQQQKIGIHRRWLGLAWAFFPHHPDDYNYSGRQSALDHQVIRKAPPPKKKKHAGDAKCSRRT